jgi:hypothetical protein
MEDLQLLVGGAGQHTHKVDLRGECSGGHDNLVDRQRREIKTTDIIKGMIPSAIHPERVAIGWLWPISGLGQ